MFPQYSRTDLFENFMICTVEFDKFRHIEYRDISKLYWNQFPYKVLLSDGIKRPAGRVVGFSENQEEWTKYRLARRKFYNRMRRLCPEQIKCWKSTNNGFTFSFFFASTEDALNFIDKAQKYIKVVFRPENDAQIAALKRDRRLVLRETLFYPTPNFAGYRYCIEFHTQFKASDEIELDDCINHIFNGRKDKRRYYYDFSIRRRLFLNRENDIMHVKLALYEKIRSQTEVILKSEI